MFISALSYGINPSFLVDTAAKDVSLKNSLVSEDSITQHLATDQRIAEGRMTVLQEMGDRQEDRTATIAAANTRRSTTESQGSAGHSRSTGQCDSTVHHNSNDHPGSADHHSSSSRMGVENSAELTKPMAVADPEEHNGIVGTADQGTTIYRIPEGNEIDKDTLSITFSDVNNAPTRKRAISSHSADDTERRKRIKTRKLRTATPGPSNMMEVDGDNDDSELDDAPSSSERQAVAFIPQASSIWKGASDKPKNKHWEDKNIVMVCFHILSSL